MLELESIKSGADAKSQDASVHWFDWDVKLRRGMPCGSCAQGHGAPFKAEVAISAIIENQQRCTSRLVTSLKTQFDRQIRRRTWHHLKAGSNHISKKDRSGGLKRADHTWHETQTVSKFENDFIVITRRWLRPKESLFRMLIRRGCKLTAQSRSFPRVPNANPVSAQSSQSGLWFSSSFFGNFTDQQPGILPISDVLINPLFERWLNGTGRFWRLMGLCWARLSLWNCEFYGSLKGNR